MAIKEYTKPREICSPATHLPDNEKQRQWAFNSAAKRVVLMDGLRTCRLCACEKHVTGFHINRQMKGGRTHECKTCIAIKQRAWRKKALHRPAFVEARKLSQLKVRAKKYGITLDELQAMEARANGACDICGNAPKARGGPADHRLHVDHCHTTGRVRGMLCTDCNRALGIFSDDPALLRRAAAYLEHE